MVEKYYNFFPIFTGVKILCKFTTIKVVIYSSIPLGKKKPPFVVEINFHYKRWFFSLQPYSLLFSHSTLRGELFPPFWSHSGTQGQLLKFTHHLHHGLFIASLVQLLAPFTNFSQNIPLGPNEFQTFNSVYCEEL